MALAMLAAPLAIRVADRLFCLSVVNTPSGAGPLRASIARREVSVWSRVPSVASHVGAGRRPDESEAPRDLAMEMQFPRIGSMLGRVLPFKAILIAIATFTFTLSALPGCASSQMHVNDVQHITQRLQGSWLLTSYRPSVALEAPLQGMLGTQLGQMRVVIEGTQITASGPGLQVARSYQIQEVVDQTATLVVAEPSGVSVRVWIEMRDPVLTFRPLDAPWSGEGTLQRL